ncbi:MAG TPA: T9SS type A sorting domain-containing protein [Bacteroidales bacterium]|nr:T9SS type A sorting domain-containing protein [Bacteroidales bacterium]
MNTKTNLLLTGTMILFCPFIFGQEKNCFLNDFVPKTAVIPASVNANKPTDKASVLVKLKNDTIGKVSKYVYGNAIVAWAGSYTNTEFVDGVKKLQPSLIRWPGGSWADGWFLDKIPTDVPDSVYDGTKYTNSIAKTPKNKFGGHHGKEGGWVTTTDQYYTLRQKTGVSEGLITVNYAYARYGTSKDPVSQAAHEAARWVRYDAGRTKFWEIGNENGGPWEYGWMIDTTLNQDGQPTFMSGALYGKHFKVFADSMRNAAKETGATIYIGGQVMAGEATGGGQWGNGDRAWNEGFFKEVGDYADFYVIHNYFSNSTDVNSAITAAITSLRANAEYVKKDIIKKNGISKPIALTEYNMNSGNDVLSNSYVMGMQAVALMCEMIKGNWGLGSRWNLETLFSGSGNYANHPHADFYYLYYLQKLYGDMAFSSTSSNKDVLSYTTKYSSSGDVAMVIINKGNADQVVTVSSDSVGVGEKYYIYSFTAGTETTLSPYVYINENGPDFYHYGPYDGLADIKAYAYTIDDEIKFTSPAKSLQMILIEAGNKKVVVNDPAFTAINSASGSTGITNYPNPVGPSTLITYQLPKSSMVTLKVCNLQGKTVSVLVNQYQNAGYQAARLNAANLPAGIYFYTIDAGSYHETRKFIKL